MRMGARLLWGHTMYAALPPLCGLSAQRSWQPRMLYALQATSSVCCGPLCRACGIRTADVRPIGPSNPGPDTETWLNDASGEVRQGMCGCPSGARLAAMLRWQRCARRAGGAGALAHGGRDAGEPEQRAAQPQQRGRDHEERHEQGARPRAATPQKLPAGFPVGSRRCGEVGPAAPRAPAPRRQPLLRGGRGSGGQVRDARGVHMLQTWHSRRWRSRSQHRPSALT